jgi:hypothetical protein
MKLSPSHSVTDNLKFEIGQAAILASRAASGTFKNLWDAEVKIYSQWGEDGILDFLVSSLGISKPRVLEVGVGNFLECNSRFLAEYLNASVVAIDSRTDLIASINGMDLKWKTHIKGVETWVTPDNINNLVSQSNEFLGRIDIFSLDVDGNDYWIIEQADLRGIRIVVVEYNPLFGSSLAVTVPRDDTFDRTIKHESWLYWGASLLAFAGILKNKGFDFIGTNRVGNNAFFVSSNDIDQIAFRPDPRDLKFYDWRVRESRDPASELNFLSGNERKSIIGRLPLVDLSTGGLITVADTK